MGLGPPVCINCMLVGTLRNNKLYCNGCGDQNILTHLWELDYKTQETIEANTRFMLPVWETLEHLKNEKDKD